MKVFISYRRGDAVALAGRLYDRLGSRIGVDSVFMDQEDIPVGSNFAQTIYDSIARSDVVMVLIGPKWLELLKMARESKDLVVEELATALEHKIPVIPVLLGDTSMPQESDLPGGIRGLVGFQALRLEPGERFSSDFERLMQASPFSASPRSSLVQRIRRWFRR
jgi:hypothetical protein